MAGSLRRRVEDGPNVGSLVAVKSAVSAWVLSAHLTVAVYEEHERYIEPLYDRHLGETFYGGGT